MKIVISKDTFGFCLSDEEIMRYAEIKGIKIHEKVHYYQIPRNDPALVQLVEELNIKSPNRKLKVVEMPYDVEWLLFKDSDGEEYIVEKYRRVWSY